MAKERIESILLTDATEITAVKAGDIDGDIYQDGQVWANVYSLLQWRSRGATLDTSATS